MTALKFAEKRRSLGLTQKELARIIGVNILAVSTWENGRHPVPQYAAVILDLISRHKEPGAYKPPR